MKRFWTLAGAVVLLLGVAIASGQTPKRKPPAAAADRPQAAEEETRPNQVGAFMRLKLDHSQKVLEGVVLKDFDLIAKNAQAMALLTEDENWMVLETPEYRTYSAEFKQIANRLRRSAKDKNLDGAALDYVQLTLNCVDCHKHVREAK